MRFSTEPTRLPDSPLLTSALPRAEQSLLRAPHPAHPPSPTYPKSVHPLSRPPPLPLTWQTWTTAPPQPPTTTPSPSPRKRSRLRAWLASPSRSLTSPSSPRASSSADEWDLLTEAEGAEHWGRDRCGYPSSERGVKGLVKPHPEVRAARRYKLASAASGSPRGRQAREQAEGSSGG